MQASSYQRGLIMVILGVVFLSFDGLLIRLAATDGWIIVFWRGLLMFCVLGLLCSSGKRLTTLRHHPFSSLASALLLGLISSLFVLAVMNANVANVVVILSTAPLFAALFSRFLWAKASHSARQWPLPSAWWAWVWCSWARGYGDAGR